MPILSAFRYRNYRIYWSGMLVATMGAEILKISLLWLVYDLTGSTLYLGFVGGIQGVATIVFGLFGGVLADRVDRRRLIWATNLTFFLIILALAVMTAGKLIQVWHLVVFSAMFGTVTAFDTPSRQALIPNLIGDRKHLMNAIAMHSVIWQSSRVVGPALAGILIAVVGMAPCFFIAAAAHLAMVVAMSLVHLAGPVKRAGQSVAAALVEGVQYVRGNSAIFSVIGMVFVNSLFGMSFIFLMPVFAKDIFQGDSSSYGFLMTAMGVGTLCGGLFTAASSRFKSKHVFLLGASAAYGLLLIGFSFSRVYSGSVALLALAGFMQQVYMVTAQTVVQWMVTEEVRGRVMGIYSLVWSLTPV
ncbi:MAG: MFS transporter, partial [Dehalococcoidia bacterium]|nr:MFS transporter [Dehalococcoidia bacterium]